MERHHAGPGLRAYAKNPLAVERLTGAAWLWVLAVIWLRPGGELPVGVDAACYGEVAQASTGRGLLGIVDPHLWDTTFAEHPPGMIWLEHALFVLLQPSGTILVFSARLLTTLNVLLTTAIARRVGSETSVTGTLMTLPLLSGFLAESQNPMLELPLGVGLLFATWASLVWPAGRLGLMGAACGVLVGFWAKGPPAAACWLIWLGWYLSGTLRFRRLVALVLSSGAAVTVTALMFDGVRLLKGLPSFWHLYWQRQLWPSMVYGRAQPSSDPFFYAKMLWRWYPVGLVLTACWIIGRVCNRSRISQTPAHALANLGMLWVLAIAVPFTLMRQKYQWYIHPCMWGFAWVGGACWAAWKPQRTVRRMATWCLVVTALSYVWVTALWPAPFRPRAERARRMAQIPSPMWRDSQQYRIALCDGPWTWRESHTAGFLWHARAVPCDDPQATMIYDGQALIPR